MIKSWGKRITTFNVIHTEEMQMGCDHDILGFENDRLSPELGFGYVMQ